MAASFMASSDMLYDHPCWACEQRDLNSEALHFCIQCTQTFCPKCLRKHETLFPSHQVLGKEDMHRWRGRPAEICNHHPDKHIEMYCEDHDTVGCTVCFTIQHRSCKVVKDIPSAAKDIRKQTGFKSLPAQVQTMKTKLKITRDNRKKNRRDLMDSCKKIVSTVTDLKVRMNQLMEDLQQRTLSEMRELESKLEDDMITEIQQCSTVHDSLDRLVTDMQDKAQKDEVKLFTRYKVCQEQLIQAEYLLKTMETQERKLTFTEDPQIQSIVKNMEGLGKLVTVPVLSGPCDSSTSSAYKTVEKNFYKVSVADDTETCSITSCCQTEDGSFVVVDTCNKKLKMLNAESFKVTDYCLLPAYPHSVCMIGKEKVAVTVCNNDGTQRILCLNVQRGKMKLVQEIAMPEPCYALAHNSGLLYVGSLNTISVYNLQGKLIKRLFEDTSGKKQTVKKIAVSDDAQHIYVTNMSDESVITLDRNGNKLSSFTHQYLQCPTGICVATNGNVFVCGLDSKITQQLEKHGQTCVGSVCRDSEAEQWQQSLWFDRSKNKLIVGQHSNQICVFKVM